MKAIWTIGHSTRSIDDFIGLLRSFEIGQLADVRHFPGSRKFPHFNKPELQSSLLKAGIQYHHLVSLGGRRKPDPNSKNTGWRHPAFRGYADYMGTDDFRNGIITLEKIGSAQRTAYMCSEAVWWRCHRSLISDYLKVKGWQVNHIMDVAKSSEHPYTSPARVINNELSYTSDELKLPF